MSDERLILIVDDNGDSREVVADILAYNGFSVDAAPSAEAALDKLRQQQYAGIVIDLRLPGMSGWDLIETIREQIPCVAITAYHNAQVAQEVYEAGFIGYFPKPLDELTFAQELDRLIA